MRTRHSAPRTLTIVRQRWIGHGTQFEANQQPIVIVRLRPRPFNRLPQSELTSKSCGEAKPPLRPRKQQLEPSFYNLPPNNDVFRCFARAEVRAGAANVDAVTNSAPLLQMNARDNQLPDPDLTRALSAILRAPHDRLGGDHVLAAAARAIQVFSDDLAPPSDDLIDLVASLAEPNFYLTPHKGLRTGHPAWDLLLQVTENTPQAVLKNLGAVLIDALASGKPLTQSVVKLLEQQLRGRDIGRSKRLTAITARVARSFDEEQPHNPDESYGARLSRYYRALHHFSGEHRHQARLDRTTLTVDRYHAAMQQLRAKVETGNPTSMLLAISVVTGLSAVLARDLPLRDAATVDWVAGYDVRTGTYLLDLNVLAPHARLAPPPGTDCIHASRILERPVPASLAAALLTQHRTRPNARTIGELLDNSHASPRSLLTPADTPAAAGHIRPTLARVQRTTETVAIHAGVNRVVAAHLSGRYQATSRSKLYYAAISREALWAGAQLLFEASGWGQPTPLIPGLAAGAQTAATDTSVARWHAWMRNRVSSLRPGRRYTLEGLVAHTREYARLVGSVFVFCMAARESQALQLLASDIAAAGWLPLADKRSRTINNATADGALAYAVPVPGVLTDQLLAWQRHCGAVAQRLTHLNLGSHPLTAHLEQVAAGDPVAALIDIDDDLMPQPLGTSALASWWPEWFARSGNWARAYWQTRLTEEGIASSDIDLLMRHTQSGAHALSSESGRSAAARQQAVRRAQSRVLQALGIEAVPGVVK